MSAYRHDKRARPYPRACGGVGVEVIYCAAAWVPACQRIPRRAICALAYRLVKLSVVEAGERAGLVYYPGNGVWKRHMPYAVKHHRAYGDLTLIRLAPCFGGDEPCEQVFVTAALLTYGAASAAQSPLGGMPRAARVLSPTCPSTLNPFLRWKYFTAASVLLPYIPSTSPL